MEKREEQGEWNFDREQNSLVGIESSLFFLVLFSTSFPSRRSGLGSGFAFPPRGAGLGTSFALPSRRSGSRGGLTFPAWRARQRGSFTLPSRGSRQRVRFAFPPWRGWLRFRLTFPAWGSRQSQRFTFPSRGSRSGFSLERVILPKLVPVKKQRSSGAHHEQGVSDDQPIILNAR